VERSGLDLAVVVFLVFLLYRRFRSSPERLGFGVFMAMVMAAHLLLNALTAKLTLGAIWGVDSTIYDSLSLAQSIVVCGIVATLISYLVYSRQSVGSYSVKPFVRFLSPDITTVRARARAAVVVVSLAIFVLLVILGYFPLLKADPLVARVIGLSESPVLFSLLRKLVVVASLAAPMLLIGQKFRWRSVMLFLVALAAVALTANRERVLFMLLFAPACSFVARKRSFLKLVWLAPFVFLAFFLMDSFLRFGNLLDVQPAVEVMGSVLPEVRDLGWTLNAWEGGALHGKTYLADIVPVPTAILPFKNQFSLPAITRQAIGVEDDGNFVGLRITAYGEAWLNFGLPGVVVFGVFLGWLIERGEVFLAITSTLSPVRLYGAAVLVWIPLLSVYLSGTAVMWDATLLPGIVIWGLFHRVPVTARTIRQLGTSGEQSTGIVPAG
jgi:oligosaccharide repeat unit polymerase